MGGFSEILGSDSNPIPANVFNHDSVWIIVKDQFSSSHVSFEFNISEKIKDVKSVNTTSEPRINKKRTSLPPTPGPRGYIGPPGEKGRSGIIGASGDKGDKGDKGPVGNQGDKGDKGQTGDKGDKGVTGSAGDKGKTRRNRTTWYSG